MAIRPIVEVPHPVLAARAAEVGEFNDDIRTLIDDLADTMYAAPGVGLAAPQVGAGLRVIVADLDPASYEIPQSDEDVESRSLYAFVNPEIVEREGGCSMEEGCLSVPDFTIDVPRFERIVVRGLDGDGQPLELELHGFPAVVLQHEIDHLDGVTLLDKVSGLKRRLYLKKQKKKQAHESLAAP
ncbi:MAG: peptide deformylase [Myxococcota bacterium]|jgi:peptide deformylase|nr:peptide deformylase [Myxococcota bacterium]